MPKNKQLVAYKRSYPFINQNFFPQLTDLVDFSPRVKVIIMTRYFKENVLSILRRGFEKDTNIAISRIAKGYNILTQQILSNLRKISKIRILTSDFMDSRG
ncbi:hypothetical protein [Okeania sp. KiyG1]|uniref:hypothetical protein n=1 Tax=Okeania sp. KiyG1 TaxID=2720165 RepID=UPI001921C110|nr:hypothetical protein [Okeania sp. KiyG1]GFZ96882.1 hypothetical protein CYANOKiyG1_08020 [Okeania sp. KiyG1]